MRVPNKLFLASCIVRQYQSLKGIPTYLNALPETAVLSTSARTNLNTLHLIPVHETHQVQNPLTIGK